MKYYKSSIFLLHDMEEKDPQARGMDFGLWRKKIWSSKEGKRG